MNDQIRKICNREINMIETGKKLKVMAEERNLTTEDLRACLNLASRQAVYRWYRGETVPSLENLGRLELVFGVESIDDLVVFTEPLVKKDE